MSRKQEIYDSDTYEMKESEREYEEYEVMAGWFNNYYGDRRAVNKTFYEDSETGIVVSDIGKFEDWMRKVITK